MENGFVSLLLTKRCIPQGQSLLSGVSKFTWGFTVRSFLRRHRFVQTVLFKHCQRWGFTVADGWDRRFYKFATSVRVCVSMLMLPLVRVCVCVCVALSSYKQLRIYSVTVSGWTSTVRSVELHLLLYFLLLHNSSLPNGQIFYSVTRN